MRFLRKSLMGLFLLGATVALFAFAVGMVRGAIEERANQDDRRGGGPRERVFAVNAIAYEPGQITPVLQSFGELQTNRALDIRAAAGGTVIALHPSFQDGGQVDEGALLVRLDPQDAQTALAFAGADLAEAEAELREAQRGLDLAREEVLAAEDQLDLRSRALRRQVDLVARGVGTEANLESAELAESSSKQSLLSRKQALQQAEARLDLAAARVDRRKISVAEAERTLADTEIFAPFPGILSDVSLVVGGQVTANERLGQLIDRSQMEVAFRVSTAQHARLIAEDGSLRQAQVKVTLDSFGLELKTEGVLTREAALVGEGQTGRLLFASVTNPQGLRPGDFVKIEIEEAPLARVARLPSTALSSSNKVLVVGENDRLREEEVRLVRRQGDDVLVQARLRDAQIVAARSPLLGEGIRVRVLNPSADAAPEAPAMVELTPERQAKLIAFVEANNRIPKPVKERMLGQLKEGTVPAQMVERLESRMGS